MIGVRVSIVLLAALAAGQYWLGLALGITAAGRAADLGLGAAVAAVPVLMALPLAWRGALGLGVALLAAVPALALGLALGSAGTAALARLDLWPLALAALSAGLAIVSLGGMRGVDPVPAASLPLGALLAAVAGSLLAQPDLSALLPGVLRLMTATPVHLALTLTAFAILAGLLVALLRREFGPAAQGFLRALTGLLPLLGFAGTVLGIMAALAVLPEVLAGPRADDGGSALDALLHGLAGAFETTLIGLVAAVAAGFLTGVVQAALAAPEPP